MPTVPKSPLEIRPATASDAPEIARIHVSSWQHAYEGILPSEFLASLRVEDRERGWRERLSEPRPSQLRVWVATVADRIAGFASSGIARDTDVAGSAAEVFAIYLDPPFVGMGVGRELLAETVSDLRDRGFLQALLWVLRDNLHARNFYERAGWLLDGAERTEHRGDVALDEVRYELNLQ